MGTRGLYGFRKNGVDKTTYNHFDSYPDCLGWAIAQFCAENPEPEMDKMFDMIEMVSESGKPTKAEIMFCVENDLCDTGVSSGRVEDWYCLLRNIQGDLKRLGAIIRKHGKAYMIDNSGFIKDSLWCEYAYIINLDTHKLEFYKGFQKVPDRGNRYGMGRSRDGFYPCVLVAEIPLCEIKDPDKTVAYMNSLINEDEEE